MSNTTHLSMNFRSSFFLTLFAASLLTLTISCTDMAEDGITKSEIEQTQSKMNTRSSDAFPLYVVNGKVWDKTKLNKDKLSRLKPKYIKSIDVLKGEKATSEYGDKAQNGVIKMTVLNPDKAFTDLKEQTSLTKLSSSKADDGDYFVAVEDIPKLIGGLESLQQQIRYPEEARKARAEGRVIVQFIIDKEGNVTHPTVVRGVHESLDNEALRVVKQADFTPGKVNGEAVRVQYSLPITYKLPSKDTNK